MAGRSTFPLADKALGGNLTALMLGWRAKKLTLDQIGRRLEDQGVVVSRETIRRWYQLIDTNEPNGDDGEDAA